MDRDEDFPHLGEFRVGEDKADIAGHLWLDAGIEVLWVVDEEIFKDFSHQGVFTHENLGSAAHLLAGLIHLLGSDVINLHNEHLRVSCEKCLQIEVTS